MRNRKVVPFYAATGNSSAVAILPFEPYPALATYVTLSAGLQQYGEPGRLESVYFRCARGCRQWRAEVW